MASTTRVFNITCFSRLSATGSLLKNILKSLLKKVFWELPGEICSQKSMRNTYGKLHF